MQFKLRETFLSYSRPDLSELEINELVDTLHSGWLARGSKTKMFEEQFAEYLGVKYAIGMNSCTAALYTSLLCADIGAGDEVITTPMTFVSSVNTIIHAGATPVLADIDPETACIDPSEIEKKITDRTKAIVPVHYAGQACDLDRIYALADQYGLFVSEDAAHAFHTQNNGKWIGQQPKGTVSYSFYATKNLCTGEGGMLVTDQKEIAERAKCLSSHGMSNNAWSRYSKNGTWQYDVTEFGYKLNMFDMQAALGLAQLRRFDEMQSRREHFARIYDREFAKLPGIDGIKIAPNTTIHSRHLYIIKLDLEQFCIGRDQFVEELNHRNVGTSVHFIPVHYMTVYREWFGFEKGDFPNTEAYAERIISLPLYSSLEEEDIYYVVSAVKDIVEKFGK